MQTILRWFGDHLSTLILAFILSFAVWVIAVVSADPNEERTLRPVDLELIGQPSDQVIVNSIPDQVRITLNAPKSIWDELTNNPELVRAWIDLTGLEAGDHTLDVKTQVDVSPFRYVGVEPDNVRVRLEPLVRRDIPVQLVVSGELPLGYQRGEAQIQPSSITVSGPESLVERISQARAAINLSGSVETIDRFVPVQLVDEVGDTVAGLTSSYKEISVRLPISLLGRFKNVAVKVVTTGQVANGYRLTNISVSPPTFTVFSEDPDLVNELPGYVETMPVDLGNLVDDAAISIELNLPQGITAVREPNVIVQVSVAAIEGSLTLTLPLEIVGLTPDLQAAVSPETVDVIVAGPLLVLDQLTEENFRIVLDLSGLPPGVYQREPVVELAPEQVRIQTTLPESVEVTIEIAPMISTLIAPTPTIQPSPTPLPPSPTPTRTVPPPTRTPPA